LFYTDEGWVEAENLEVGDAILSLGGVYGAVDSILIENRTQTMYDLTIEEVHTFAVGDGDWVVHNECTKEPSEGIDYYYSTEKIMIDGKNRVRPTGAYARLESPTPHSKQPYTPYGFNSLRGHNRSHLIGEMFGGSSGQKNIVILYSDVNQIEMRAYEDQVRAAVLNGEVIDYAVVPYYASGNNTLIPNSIFIYAKGDKGTNIFVEIPNVP
jgi:hypothetical protein